MEIERKYIVKGNEWKSEVTESHHICQGYLSTDIGRTVRVRLTDQKAYLTIKGQSADGGLSRAEYEYEIPADDARQLLLIAINVIEKTRHIIPITGTRIIGSEQGQKTQTVNLKIELDVFEGENEGLVMAEVELPDTSTTFTPPGYLVQEVTGVERYYNLYLAQHPFRTWF